MKISLLKVFIRCISIVGVILTTLYLDNENGFAQSSFTIRPPFTGTYRLTSYFDHHYPNYQEDGFVTIFNGDTKPDSDPYCYHGHPGIDWAMYSGTPVLAVADGKVVKIDNWEDHLSMYGKHIVIDHENGYFSLYAHLKDILVQENGRVVIGMPIGNSGDTGAGTGAHLHFGLYKNGWSWLSGNCCSNAFPTDPFGWADLQGNPDPLQTYSPNPHIATCLWRSLPTDNLSCNDILREDKGFFFRTEYGFTPNDNWGYGEHSYADIDNGSTLTKAIWGFDGIPNGFYMVYAWIPQGTTNFSNSTAAKYTIHTGWGSCSVTINQAMYTDTWLFLGSWNFSGMNYPSIELSGLADGGGTGTKFIRADAIKLRSIRIFLPVIITNEPTH